MTGSDEAKANEVACETTRLLYEPPSEELKFLPEGPCALGNGRFSWVAIQHGSSADFGSLNIFDTNTNENTSYRLPGRPGFARPCVEAASDARSSASGDHGRPQQFVIGAERELALFDIGTGKWQPICSGIDQRVENTIVNDGMVWQDNLIFGTKDLEFKTKKAGLYLYRGHDKKLIQLRDDQICSNGKGVVADGEKLWLFDIDTPTRKIVRYELDINAGKLGACTTAVDLTEAVGFPDGMTLTPDGKSAIISFYNPEPAEYGLTQQYNLHSGQLESTWRTPASPQNTCPMLLPLANGKVQLVITTAVEHMPQERRSGASKSGCLFVAETSFRASEIGSSSFPWAATA